MNYSELTVCLLHPREAVAFEHHGILPGCRTEAEFHHVHIPIKDANRREANGIGVFLDPQRRYMRAVPYRVWQPKVTDQGRMRSLQLVKGCVRGRAGQFRATATPAVLPDRLMTEPKTNWCPLCQEYKPQNHEHPR